MADSCTSVETEPHWDATGVKGTRARLETSAQRQQSNQKLFFGDRVPWGFQGAGATTRSLREKAGCKATADV